MNYTLRKLIETQDALAALANALRREREIPPERQDGLIEAVNAMRELLLDAEELIQ